ncbi:homoserine dehydrogenase [Aerococcaceae bacterium INB8]|uniref:Homoserine dehydrogenase n=1 Tax=Ruoffia halotolerans TaxID=2748684 RepID=A0A839A6Z2_9LACT|nr:homoserine dehydrogenase [Ruoffia halotolerans]MBA5729443.1 homoserine dehydrogenase [Ruoffia halotolerans]
MKIAILGMGTVGSGVIKVIQENQMEIQQFTNEPIEVSHVFAKTITNQHDADFQNVIVTENIDDILNSDVELVVEVMGGIDFTFGLHQKFLSKGIHVVSANKDMLAVHIKELAKIGDENKAQLGYEASCAGGIPIINALTYGLQANKINRVLGILNGTTNYILTKMTQDAWSYDKALKDAQEKGYAEKDPTNDVEGLDARRKIALLSRIAYKQNLNVEDIPVRGISQVSVQDLEYAQADGLTMKLLGKSEYHGEKVQISVEPVLLPNNHQLATVNDAANAVYVNGNAFGETMFYGPGAGSLETASAVVSDVMNIAKFGFVGNLIVEEDANIDLAGEAASYFIRFAKGQTEVKLDVNYKVIADEDVLVIITEDMSANALEQLENSHQVEAVYVVIKD